MTDQDLQALLSSVQVGVPLLPVSKVGYVWFWGKGTHPMMHPWWPSPPIPDSVEWLAAIARDCVASYVPNLHTWQLTYAQLAHCPPVWFLPNPHTLVEVVLE